MIIIQVVSKTTSATREMLKNAKCTWSSRDCICNTFNLTYHVLNVSLTRKIDNISIIIRRMTTARAIGMLQQGAGIRNDS